MEFIIDFIAGGDAPGAVIQDLAIVAFHEGKVVDHFRMVPSMKEALDLGFTYDAEFADVKAAEDGGIPLPYWNSTETMFVGLKKLYSFVDTYRNGSTHADYTNFFFTKWNAPAILNEYYDRLGLTRLCKQWECLDIHTTIANATADESGWIERHEAHFDLPHPDLGPAMINVYRKLAMLNMARKHQDNLAAIAPDPVLLRKQLDDAYAEIKELNDARIMLRSKHEAFQKQVTQKMTAAIDRVLGSNNTPEVVKSDIKKILSF